MPGHRDAVEGLLAHVMRDDLALAAKPTYNDLAGGGLASTEREEHLRAIRTCAHIPSPARGKMAREPPRLPTESRKLL